VKFKTFIFIAILCVLFYFVIDEMRRKNVPMPTKLNPIVAVHRDQLIQKAAEKGINIVITDDFRSAAEQDKLYARGRSTEGTIVTYVEGGESYHNYGLAIDFALLLKDGTVVWDIKRDDNKNGKSDWMEVIAIGKQLGFKSGADFLGSFKDYPHFEMDFGLSIRELQYGERPPVKE
jgi:peptidoglycan L-alanyl-D-glutamate endopeptidase CwlK